MATRQIRPPPSPLQCIDRYPCCTLKRVDADATAHWVSVVMGEVGKLTDCSNEGHKGQGGDSCRVAHEEALERAEQPQALCRGEQLQLLQLHDSNSMSGLRLHASAGALLLLRRSSPGTLPWETASPSSSCTCMTTLKSSSLASVFMQSNTSPHAAEHLALAAHKQ